MSRVRPADSVMNMTSPMRRVLALPAGAVALATAALAAQAPIGAPAQSAAVHQAAGHSGWRVAKTISVRGRAVILVSLDAVSADDTWVAGLLTSKYGSRWAPLLERWDGNSWRRVLLPAGLARRFTGQQVFGFVGASSASNVWAFNIGGKYLRRAGRHWTFGRLPGSKAGRTFVESVEVFSPTDVWVFGGKAHGPFANLKFTPYAARFNGHRWTAVSVPGRGLLGPVSAISPRDMWAIAGGEELYLGGAPDSTSVLRWNGVAWQKVASQPAWPRQTILAGILARTNGDVWVGGGTQNRKQGMSEMAWHWNGRAWTSKGPCSAATGQDYFLSSLVPARGGMLALAANPGGPARVWRYAGAWSAPVSVPWSLFELAAVPHSDSIWGLAEDDETSAGQIVLHGPVPR